MVVPVAVTYGLYVWIVKRCIDYHSQLSSAFIDIKRQCKEAKENVIILKKWADDHCEEQNANLRDLDSRLTKVEIYKNVT